MRFDVRERLEGFVESAPVTRDLAYGERVWVAGRARRRANAMRAAAVAAAIAISGGVVLVNWQEPGTVPPVAGHLAAVSATSDPVQIRRDLVQRELASHADWPQRQITVKDGLLVVPYSAGDPKAYLDWIVELGYRYDGGITRTYVQDRPNAPSRAELEDIKAAVDDQLRATARGLSWVLGIYLEDGRVQLSYQPTTDAAFLSVVAQARQTYGERFYAVATENVPKLPGLVDPATP